MNETEVISARVPRALYDGARQALGLPEDARDTDLIRHAFAAVAGLNPQDFALRPGPKRPAKTERGAA